MSKYFIDREIWFQNKKQPPRKVIVHSIIKEFQDNYSICYDELRKRL